jgi:hypothetical protein
MLQPNQAQIQQLQAHQSQIQLQDAKKKDTTQLCSVGST